LSLQNIDISCSHILHSVVYVSNLFLLHDGSKNPMAQITIVMGGCVDAWTSMLLKMLGTLAWTWTLHNALCP